MPSGKEATMIALDKDVSALSREDRLSGLHRIIPRHLIRQALKESGKDRSVLSRFFQRLADQMAGDNPMQTRETIFTRKRGDVLVQSDHRSLLARWHLGQTPSWQEAFFLGKSVER